MGRENAHSLALPRVLARLLHQQNCQLSEAVYQAWDFLLIGNSLHTLHMHPPWGTRVDPRLSQRPGEKNKENFSSAVLSRNTICKSDLWLESEPQRSRGVSGDPNLSLGLWLPVLRQWGEVPCALRQPFLI